MQTFGDGFDCYATPADTINGYWDSGTTGFTLVAGRFSGSQAIQNSATGAWLVKTSGGTADTIHHIICAFQQTAALTGTTLGMYFQLSDGATNQVCIVFRSDGAILLTSATPAGTVLATYTGAVTATSTWYAFEFEVVIDASTGSFTVRKNGNASNDFTLGSLNTRPGINTQANKLTIGVNAAVNNQQLDDLLWRSDTAAVAFAGDLRCYTRRPASDAAVQWTPSGSVVPYLPFPGTTTQAAVANGARYLPFTAPCGGTVGSVAFNFTVASTANWKAAIYNASGGVPTTSLATSTAVAAPAIGVSTFTFSSPPTLTAGGSYFVAICSDAASGTYSALASGLPGGLSGTTTYASFPAANPTSLVAANVPAFTVNTTPSGVANAPFVADNVEDGANSYIYSSTVSQSDLYGISSIASTPATVVAVTTRAYLQKSDAGTRNTSVNLKSGATTVSSTSAALNTVWSWQYRTDTVDPATGSAWTAVGVSNCNIGVSVTA